MAEHRCQPPAIALGATHPQQPDWTCGTCGRVWRDCRTSAGTQWWAEVRGLEDLESLRRVGPLLSAAELAAILRHELWTEAEQAALARHIDALDATIANQNREMDRQAGVVEELTAQLRQALRERDEARAELSTAQGQMIDDLHALGEVLGHERTARPYSPQVVLRMWTAEVGELVEEVRRALYRTGLGEVMGRGLLAEDVPLLAALLTPAAGPQGTHHEE